MLLIITAAGASVALFAGPTVPVSAGAASRPAVRMMSDAGFTSKKELLLDEEIDRSGVEADIEEKVLDSSKLSVLDAVQWSPSARGEPGKTPRDLAYGPLDLYATDLYEVKRRETRTVECGPIKFGSEHPLVRQTMATTLTSDVEGTIEQVIKCADEGFDLVRVTVVGMKDAKACMAIRKGLDERGYDIPLCADMHFAPKVALAVADAVEKIRINPGNFVDGRKTFEETVYETDEDYFKERAFFVEAFTPLVEKCKALNRAMRIGTNHGSLSARVLSFYGAPPAREGREGGPRGGRGGGGETASRRHAARDGRVRDRVRRHLPLARLPQLCLFDEGVQPAGDGAGVPPAGGGDEAARVGLPAAPGRDRGGRGRGRPHEERHRHRRPPRRRPRGHHPRLSDGGPRVRVRAVQPARRDRRRPARSDRLGRTSRPTLSGPSPPGTARHSDSAELAGQRAVASYTDSRDFQSFARRSGRLPEQQVARPRHLLDAP